ncbi:hypothetical protein [Leucobacter luti]|uniref:Uridine kinase n=1 Tax=Leucobacter luti TaxID=340320 RepID=A0A4Q7TXN1_9MICO|nr:hypothetical protein [Leucobacter luti]MBL3698616.1 hypothetical protein [Leucobacter luti]RZT65991.1 hypothetical protein EV139_1415 [Leucobacter luti]
MGLHRLHAVVIDGRSGAGKTVLADRLASRLRGVGRDAQILRVEDLYPGWDGLTAGSRSVTDALGAGSYRRFDWNRGEFAERVELDPGKPLIVEGCGAVTAANLEAVRDWVSTHGARAAATEPGADSIWSVWLDLPREERRTRALARDGAAYAPHWDRWAAQEDAHYADHAPWEIVNEVLRG